MSAIYCAVDPLAFVPARCTYCISLSVPPGRNPLLKLRTHLKIRFQLCAFFLDNLGGSFIRKAFIVQFPSALPISLLFFSASFFNRSISFCNVNELRKEA